MIAAAITGRVVSSTVFKACVALGLLSLLWVAADGAQIAEVLAGAEPIRIVLAVLLLMTQTALSACRWRVTAAEFGQRFSMIYAVREYFLSQVVNQAVPGAVVGDTARAVRARHDGGLAVSGAAVALERLAGQLAMFLTLALGIGMTYLTGDNLTWPTGLRHAVAAAVLIGGVALLLTGLAARLRIVRHGRWLRWVSEARRALCARHVLPAQLSLGFLITLCNIAAFAACAMAVGISLPVLGALVLVPLILFSMLVPLTISGWGVREGAAAALLPIAGPSVAESIGVSVLFGLAIVLASTPGLLAMVNK